MKKLHLICNAHIDPVWQWEWEEGASAVLSTFQSAVNLADEYDFIFCHNEAMIYKYVEEYAPTLFGQIQELIKAGKWHIMGGWYLQPDCNMPSGESLVRQIQVGKKYFWDKFGKTPKTAVSMDAFGHSIGIVQIIKKCGQDNYLFWRPFEDQCPLGTNQFFWEGLDGSELKCNRTLAYFSRMGLGRWAVEDRMAKQKDEEIATITWGIGNHGGGPSRIDLKEINEFIEESKDVEIIHSTPDVFFAEMVPEHKVDKSLHITMPGCYTSLANIKQKHIELEQNLMFTEKILSAATLAGLTDYPQSRLSEAVENLMNSEFHDALPGTVAYKGAVNTLEYLNGGLRIVNELRAKAFFALSSLQSPAENGEFPVLVFNPHPYELETNVEVEFSLEDQNWKEERTNFKVLDGERELPFQIIKEESTINLDWRKKIIFACKLKPMQINRFSIYKNGLVAPKQHENTFVYSGKDKYVEIDKNTGCMISYKVDGKEYINGDAFLPIFYDDNADPWAMRKEYLPGWHKNRREFKLDKKPSGVFKGLESIEVIEDGDIYLGIECFFKHGDTRARVEYKIYKENLYVDVNVNVFMAAVDKMLKLQIPVQNQGDFIGQCPFGTDVLNKDGRENVAQRFVAMRDIDGDCLAIFNNCIYGNSYNDGNIELSLVRGIGYCVHPIYDRPLMPEGRYIRRADQGEISYSFRLCVCKENELERLATEFNQRPYALNVFPIKTDIEETIAEIKLTNKNITLVTLKKSELVDGYILRLINNYSKPASTRVYIDDRFIDLEFGKYEVKTVEFNGEFAELDEMLI